MPPGADRELKALIEESWAEKPIVRPTADIFNQRIMAAVLPSNVVVHQRWIHGRVVVNTKQGEYDSHNILMWLKSPGLGVGPG